MVAVLERQGPELTPPELGRAPVSIEPYRSSAYFELEREHIFKRVWLCVGREEEIPGNGDFFVKDVEVFNASALVVRGQDGVVRAFHNVCSHRCNKVVWESSGTAKQFVCKYHHWTYGLNGALRGVPDALMFFDLQKSDCALTPIYVDLWEGFIFLNFAPRPAESLSAYLGGLGRKLQGYPFARFSAYAKLAATFKANWKVGVDAFQEGYHVGALHRRTIGPQFTSSLNPFGRLISAELFGPHRSGSIWGNRELRPRPTELTAFTYNTPIGSDKEVDAEIVLPPGINPTRDPNWAVEMNVIFPGLFVFVSRQGYILHNFIPVTHELTRWECHIHFTPPRSARQLFAQQFSICAVRDTFVEDGINIERSQEGIRSGAKACLHFQDNEVFLRHQIAVVEDYVRRGAAAGPPGA
jgi:glycine betaine catabolism A